MTTPRVGLAPLGERRRHADDDRVAEAELVEVRGRHEAGLARRRERGGSPPRDDDLRQPLSGDVANVGLAARELPIFVESTSKPIARIPRSTIVQESGNPT